jgi:hypothetical protein
MPKRQYQDLEAIGKRVCQRFDDGVRYAANFRQRIDLLAPYIEPTRSGIQASQAPGEALMSRMYDSEGISAADLAVRQMGSYLHGPGSQWFSLEDENEFVNNQDEGREWYQDCRDRMLKQAAQGAFYPESYESDMDWIGFGTGLMRAEENPMLMGREQFGFRGVRFTHHKAGRFVVYENGIGQVDETYIELRKTARAAVDLWGYDKLPENIQEAYKNDKADEFRFIHGVSPRKQSEKAYGKTAMPWASCYVHYDTKQVVSEGGYEEFPDCVPRWTRCHGEPYGRGLGEIALNTLITLNAATKHDLEAMALRIKPALAQRHDAVVGAKRLSPWGVTVVRVAPGENVQNAIAPIVTNMGNYSFSQIDAEKLKQMVRRIFYADMLEQLMALEGQQEMRVYVFQQKQNIVQKLLGPTYGRWESEFGIPIVARMFNVMLRANAFAPIPDIILEMGGQPKVRFESPLARAQRMEEIDGMNQAMQALMPIIQMQLNEWKMTGKQPQNWVLDGYDFDKYTEKINRNYGVPATVTRSNREIMAIRQSRAQAEQQQEIGQELMQTAEGIGKVAPALKALTDQRQAA